MHARSKLGRAGEDLAARHLESLGFAILDRNFRCREGELDLVARRGRTLVICEVKTRHDSPFGTPADAVDLRKQARLRGLAARWLSERKPGRVEVRFDVVSVIVRQGKAAVVHIPDAF